MPHVAGSDGDFKTAEIFLSHLQEWFNIAPPEQKPIYDAGTSESQEATRGIIERDTPSAWIDTYYPVMNTPLERALQILNDDGTIAWEADLKEHGDDRDPDAAKFEDAVPTFHGYSVSGDVTGHLVYCDYCTKDARAPLKGSIVLCRYCAIVRGLKVKGGQENGAVGVLIYSDPRDDGDVTEENGYAPYPDGPARNPTSVQRGSVQFISLYPGDPTTPGYPSYENATRTEGTNIPSIPSLPISWGNARQLLRILEVSEHKQVRLVNNVDTRVIPIWNVIGVIPGYIKDEVVIAGNHRDAWVLGAVDPNSGTTSVHEVIRGFGHLMKNGWKPLRTIVIASWDAEEYGLIGSTEWGEDFVDWIDAHVVAYFNLDSSVSGSQFGTSGSPLLAHFIRETAQDVPHPTDANRTLWDARNDDGPFTGPASQKTSRVVKVAQTEAEAAALAVADDFGVSPLGSGSDYTVFLQRNGIPSTDEGFGSTPHDPAYHYHSVYDSETWQEKYGDPGFFRHVAVAQHLGLEILRMADAPLLPFNTTHYTLQLDNYLDTVESLPETQALNLKLKKVRRAIRRLRKASLELDKEKCQAMNELMWQIWKYYHSRHGCLGKLGMKLRRLVRRIDKRFRHHHGHRHLTLGDISDGGIDVNGHKDRRGLIRAIQRVRAVNNRLRSFEAGFISVDGIKDREWFKHLGVAPGKWLGYGATTFPGLTEAIVFDQDEEAANHEMKRLITLMKKMAKSLQE
ncbi:hypothetical protein AGABI1DRAFT_72743 [Agaricus bisporus var. burnettii JB137-S8]|uniref:Zn-dependent exopeptidase n=1 Tax=Agaricus bisporus var. burnettii (strain JB137-S8 / ATCC MYA-4627 / FGSC 10392) TaxID=597362 RepID=K5XXG3_AGABU|nr:uncharacterized protein AGABI1DRAFT_72743 [Agaricus bisporus var. burnettii JB137-S8]EKM79985.1 hypothetical protein AGABI1DRAFT_72743 [Agaricus bisporus var. burnettii JB137-S8]